jgi:hypothetical protein
VRLLDPEHLAVMVESISLLNFLPDDTAPIGPATRGHLGYFPSATAAIGSDLDAAGVHWTRAQRLVVR